MPIHNPPNLNNKSKASAFEKVAHPHTDRDESVAMTDSASLDRPDPHIEQAARDLANGLKDTSRAPEMDRSYKKMSGKPDE